MAWLKTSQTAILVAVGWGCLATWADLFGHSAGFAAPYSGLLSLGNMRVFWLGGLFVFAVFLALAPRWFERNERYVFYCMPLAASFGTMSFAISCQQTFFPAEVVALVGIIVSGAAYSWFTCLFCKTLAQTQRMSYIVASIVAGLVIKAILVQLCTGLLSESFQVGLAIFLPLGVAGFAFLAEKGVPTRVEVDEWKPDPESKTTGYRYLLPQVAVAAVAVATARVITPLGFFGDPLQLFTGTISATFGTVGVCVVLIALSYVVLAKRISRPLSKRFVPAFLVIILAFFVSGLSSSSQDMVAAFSEVFITATELLTHALFWTTVATAIRLKNDSPFRIVGAATGFYDILSIVWVAFFFSLGVVNNAAIFMVAFVLVLLLIWLIDRSGTDVKIPENMVADRRAALAERYALSPRETDVFMMLAQGRSRAYISEELVLSEGTIKTHISHIYTKLGVTNKQEMFDLLLKTEEQETA